MASERPFIVGIDGPAGAGKSSASKILARRLGFQLVDTGAIYRCVAFMAQRENVDVNNEEKLKELLTRIRVSFRVVADENRVFLDGEDVSAEIRTPEISMAASQVSSRPVVRSALMRLQRRLALEAPMGAILEGRDIGTVVFPDADLKFFLEASADIRARRRYEEFFQKGVERSLSQVLTDQTQRDLDDTTRAVSPLKAADDAIRIDSSLMPLSEVVQEMERRIRQKMAERASAP